MGDRKIIVYHSRGEEAFDEWLWDGGAQYIAIGLCVLIVFLLIVNHYGKKRGY